MKQWLLLMLGFTECLMLLAQPTLKRWNPLKKYTDTMVFLPEMMPADDLPVVLINENERNGTGYGFSPSLLGASRDVFSNAANFQLSALRYRIRGYDPSLSTTVMNGLPMNLAEDGVTPWGLWGGLNEFTRNTVMMQGMHYAEQGFGNIGNSTSMDVRASGQRKQWQLGHQFSNRSYQHKYSLSYASGFTKNDWAMAFGGSRRIGAEGHYQAVGFEGASYFLALDKKLNRHLLSLAVLGAVVYQDKQAPVTAEAVALFGSNYNPYWGYQGNLKRNSASSRVHRPVMLLSHEYKRNNNTYWFTSLGYVFGKRYDTGLDWYQSADPRPDYYRYLPSFQTDSILQQALRDELLVSEDKRQINWAQLFALNKQQQVTISDVDGIIGKKVSGYQASYFLQNRINQLQRLALQSKYHQSFSKGFTLDAGLLVQWQRNLYYKTIHDLLGADFHVNWNQFAENDVTDNKELKQFDLDVPNRIVREGDAYGYRYAIQVKQLGAWVQSEWRLPSWDITFGMFWQKTEMHRIGYWKNGLFPMHSQTNGTVSHFSNGFFKIGTTYKLSGKHYLQLYGAFLSRPPFAEQLFVSPAMRDTKQESPQSEKIQSFEWSYLYQAPKLKLRFSLYHTRFTDGMQVQTFYHDGYRNFVNHAIRHINKLHQGMESGLSLQVHPKWELTVFAGVGDFYYTSRQQVTVSLDNDASMLESMKVYAKHYRVGGSPQQVMGMGLGYRGTSLFGSVNANYFTDRWLDWNPLRRTYNMMEGVVPQSEQWNAILQQEKLPPVLLVNLYAGNQFRWFHRRQKKYDYLFAALNMNNLLDLQNILSGGYEQLRFDVEGKNPNRFPPKYYYAYGRNYSITISIRF